MYNLAFLPSARQDLVGIVQYISMGLKNPVAAEQMANALTEAAERIAAFPYANPVYIPIRPLRHEYRKCPVRNYLIFYWVEEEKQSVTVARVIYAKRDYAHMVE